ncbi:motile sperm domain-containing protein 1-like [Xiphias gladius]|uniref:motile sperm domain-containing protein 1-like n=1 Tax=Xiphias gladius TaxID=8245 RepID=UPI001A98E802|nr:motile sperm domain-containing protein 1-like [Xiphias gladius]XP_039996774.1 motile sperm domain-containing protein 1-like [Xiphias gladius]XP_039996775.1 motile sperm domain-containing protein 1-like [Xiphias gladius]XP_039996776.1 motile sperm domain-containing protein 1-like [Xiphias gladius]XP_039996777.1 motile sperm domain-containing protein 1-like [Xiphias gladius]XP_039996778.1 motile sperm domain-containing protein 1-like [Xiphias gladius]
MRRRDIHDGQGQGGRTDNRGQVVVRQAGRGKTGGEMGGETGGEPGVVSPLPVFLFPTELVFYSDQRNSHRRVLTLYNPYRFRISFKMLCTAPSLYRVVEAEGSVRAKSCVDLVVRHLDISPRNWGRRDRFRMEVKGGGQVGEREIWAELRGGEEGGGRGGEEEEERRSKRGGGGGGGGQQRALSALTPLSPLLVPTQKHLQLPTCTAVRSVSQWVVCVMVAVVCVAVLMLPLHAESSSMVPHCLHVSTNQKLACAYTLGLLTMVFLR